MNILIEFGNFMVALDTKYGLYFENGLINSIAYCCFTIILAYVLYKFGKKIINKKDPDNRKIIVTMWKIFVVTISMYTCLGQFKPIQTLTKTLLASGGVLALVLSLAAQESIGNLIAGIMIVIFKPFAVGDLVKINNGEYVGHIEEITLRHTIIRNYEHNRITIPNSIMNKNSIENYDMIDAKKVNFLEIQVSYECNLDKAVFIIKEEIKKHPHFIEFVEKEKKKALAKGKQAKPVNVSVKLIDFGENGIMLRAYVPSLDSGKGFDMLSDLRFSIKKRFDKEGIEIPYPHRTVIVKDKTEKKS